MNFPKPSLLVDAHFDVRLIRPQHPAIAGKIYYPHPDRKPDVLELLLPFVEGLKYGMKSNLAASPEQMILEAATT